MRVLYDFQAEGANELSTYAGEELTVVDPVSLNKEKTKVELRAKILDTVDLLIFEIRTFSTIRSKALLLSGARTFLGSNDLSMNISQKLHETVRKLTI